jgi:hypothetical protein
LLSINGGIVNLDLAAQRRKCLGISQHDRIKREVQAITLCETLVESLQNFCQTFGLLREAKLLGNLICQLRRNADIEIDLLFTDRVWKNPEEPFKRVSALFAVSNDRTA